MPFFDTASNYRINGGNFHDLQGDINEHHYNNSVQVDGQGNEVAYVQGLYQNRPGSNIINNSSGPLTIIGQGDNARIQLSHSAFQGYKGYNGVYQMTPYPQVHVSMPQHNPGYATFPYSPPGSHHFDPPTGHPQQFLSQQTMYPSSNSNVDQFPRADVPSNYMTGPISTVGTQTSSSWSEPSGAARSTIPIEHPVDSGSFYAPAAPCQAPPMMSVPSPARASAPLQIPSSLPVPEPLPPPPPPPTSVQLAVPSALQNVGSGLISTSPVAPPSTPSWNSPQERAITPPESRSSVRAARPKIHRSPSDLSQDTAQWNFTTPYPHRAVDQTHAHEALHIAPLQDGVSAPHSAVPNSPTEVRMLERVPSPSPSHRSPSARQPSSSGTSQSVRTSQRDTISTHSNQTASTSVASASTPAAVRSLTIQENRVSAQLSEKPIRGVHEVELSLESTPPPAYSLEPETHFQTGEISQEATPVINSPSNLNTGVDNQENRYSPSNTEAVRQEDCSMPDIIPPKKKKKKRNIWKFADVIMRRSTKNTEPVLEL